MDGITVSMDISLSKLQEMVKDRGDGVLQSMGLQRVQHLTKQLSLSHSFEELMLKLKLQYFDYLMQRTDSLEKTLMLGKIEGERRKG